MKQNIKVAVDAIVFGYSNNQLMVLLIRRKYGEQKGQWALPGGFVKDDEGLDTAVVRELQEEAGISVSFLEQLYTFGDQVDRDPRFRVISVAYFALVNPSRLVLKADTDADDAQWFPVQELPVLAFDHADIIRMAVARLQSKLKYQPIGFDLLPEQFLFSDLEQLYATILNQDIDRRNFRKKILSLGVVEETTQKVQQQSGRPAMLFRFNKRKYQKLQKEGISFEIKFA
ncbi:NUDIX hydrolase [Edaphocola flava]|uniref:NUDIX hydrolase n=1 Tax=Edaphocola flava TaxID=2499629 RepID=UPI00100A6BFE|nr:NUDIX domain-containing protein [Edaphocola flava]